ncbi:7668_t:CDS:1 [Ambispora leptoticha]|uniref:7668_t:CDS:1 n=1 Tax=Ambispora leptoticha TaxID=144679 RepID=A0A9N9CBF5_9GLOM|nr:7668_t:CDS:1 [Ambispora leptoticha]
MPKDFQTKNFSSFIRNESFNSIELDKIDVPYPLDGNLVNLLKNNLNEPSKKPPNSFILYRKAFKEISKYHGFRLSASEISRQASKNWKALADPVKQEYKKIAEMLRENTEKHAFVTKWNIVMPSDLQRKINKKKKPSLDNTSENNVSENNAANLLQEPPMTTIFPYADLSYIESFEELFTYTYDLPETMLLNQNLIYSEPPMTTINAHENSISICKFKSYQCI